MYENFYGREKNSTLTQPEENAIIKPQASSLKLNSDQKLNVLYVSYWGDFHGGAGRSLYHMMLDMRARHNVEPHVLAYTDGDLTVQCSKDGINAIIAKHYPCVIFGHGFKKRLKSFVKVFLNRTFIYRKIISFLKQSGLHFDIIHTNTHTSDIGYTISRELSVPHVVHLREHGSKDMDIDFVLPEFIIHRNFSGTAANIAISQSVYNHYVNERRVCPPERTRVIYNGLKVPAEYTKQHDEGRVNFCMAGGFVPHKNQIIAVKACDILRKSTDRFTLHFLGGDKGIYAESVKNLVASYGLEEHVKFWGFRSDVNDILRDMDVGLMLSRREGFGRVTVEYMMHYMPVIGVNTGATPEIVTDGDTGFLCSLDDAEKLAELMLRFINQPELLSSMGKSARERAVKNFSLERNTDEIYSLYQEILGR